MSVSPAPLPALPGASTAEAARISRSEYERLANRAKLLSWLSLGWMTIEGGVAITAGVVASSIALIGFGLDSAIEGFASLVIVWRFTGDRMFSHQAETRAQKLVAIQFFLLAPYVGFESVQHLVSGEHPATSWIGIALATSSVVLMPMLGIAKQRIADQIGSSATKGEGRQNMLCAYLAGALLVGLLGNMLAGAWWLDSTVGLLIAALAIKEGSEAWRGEGCCVESPLPSYGSDDARGDDDCCSTMRSSPSAPCPSHTSTRLSSAAGDDRPPGLPTPSGRTYPALQGELGSSASSGAG